MHFQAQKSEGQKAEFTFTSIILIFKDLEQNDSQQKALYCIYNETN